MIRLAIVVEGRTEERFVNDVLAAHLARNEIIATPILISGRGGDVTQGGVVADMIKHSWSHDAVTTMVDFYGFRDRPADTAVAVEEAIDAEVRAQRGASWDERRAFAYVQLHEFEALLFADVAAFETLARVSSKDMDALREIRARFAGPEQINDGIESSPSKRIERVLSWYKKSLDGPSIAARIGLAGIRAECPRFDAWVGRLEALGGPGRGRAGSAGGG